jgi:hypothetical protein
MSHEANRQRRTPPKRGFILPLVPRTGLEPVRIAPSDFKSLVSTDSTIPAGLWSPAGPQSIARNGAGRQKKQTPGCPGGLLCWWRWRESNSRPGPRSAYIYVCIPHSGCGEQAGPRAGFPNLTPLKFRRQLTGITGASSYLCRCQSAKSGAIWGWLRLSSEGECCRLELNVAS